MRRRAVIIVAVAVGNARREAHRQRALRLASALPPDARLSHESAAIVSGLPTYDVPAAVQVTRPSGRPVRTSDVVVYVAGLRPRDGALADGVAVTSPARTVVDLGRRRPFLHALVAADAALRRGTSREQMYDVLRHQWNWPRVRHAMTVVREADGRSESPLESYVRGRCVLLDLPRPDLQRWIGDAEAPIARVDFYWEQFRLIGEADGRVKYRLDDCGNPVDPDVLVREKEREEAVRDAGAEMIRWGWRDARATDDAFAARVQAAMRRGLTGRIARQLVTDALTGTNVIDLARMGLSGLT